MKWKVAFKIIAMKRFNSMINLLLAFSLLSSPCSTSGPKDGVEKTNVASNSNKILIVYLSRTNNTKAIAEVIQKNVGGSLVAIELEKPAFRSPLVSMQIQSAVR